MKKQYCLMLISKMMLEVFFIGLVMLANLMLLTIINTEEQEK
jgi:hypothetical protein